MLHAILMIMPSFVRKIETLFTIDLDFIFSRRNFFIYVCVLDEVLWVFNSMNKDDTWNNFLIFIFCIL